MYNTASCFSLSMWIHSSLGVCVCMHGKHYNRHKADNTDAASRLVFLCCISCLESTDVQSAIALVSLVWIAVTFFFVVFCWKYRAFTLTWIPFLCSSFVVYLLSRECLSLSVCVCTCYACKSIKVYVCIVEGKYFIFNYC